MKENKEKLAEAIQICLEKNACYWYRGACGLSSGKIGPACPNLNRNVVLKMEFYSSPGGRTQEECFKCEYEKK